LSDNKRDDKSTIFLLYHGLISDQSMEKLDFEYFFYKVNKGEFGEWENGRIIQIGCG